MHDVLIGAAVVGPILLAYLLLVGTAIVQIVRDPVLTGWARDAWILGIVLLPILGTVAWYGIGHRTAEMQGAWRGRRGPGGLRL